MPWAEKKRAKITDKGTTEQKVYHRAWKHRVPPQHKKADRVTVISRQDCAIEY